MHKENRETLINNLEEALYIINNALNEEKLNKREFNKLDTISSKLFNFIDNIRG